MVPESGSGRAGSRLEPVGRSQLAAGHTSLGNLAEEGSRPVAGDIAAAADRHWDHDGVYLEVERNPGQVRENRTGSGDIGCIDCRGQTLWR
jgi:hypothetical protein